MTPTIDTLTTLRAQFNEGYEEGKALIEAAPSVNANPFVLFCSDIVPALADALKTKSLYIEQQQALAEFIPETRVLGKEAGITLTLVRNSTTATVINKIAEITLRPDGKGSSVVLEYKNLNAINMPVRNRTLAVLAKQLGMQADGLGVYSKTFANNDMPTQLLPCIGKLVAVSDNRSEKPQHIAATPKPSDK